jgi:exopolysaccharide biosynthesis polyprenyl glycosylphosphotransferase
MKPLAQGINTFGSSAEYAATVPRQKAVSNRLLWVIYICYLMVCDVFMIVQAFKLAFYVRFGLALPFFKQDAFDSIRFYSNLSIVLVPLWLVIFACFGLYRKQNLLGGVHEYQLVGRATTIGMLFLIMFGFLEPEFIIARGWVLLAWWLSCALVIFGRFLLRRGVYLLRRRGYFVTPAVIVGANDEGLSLARQLKGWRTSGLVLVGFVDKKLKPGTPLFDGLSVLGPVEKLDEIIKRYEVEELILASSAISTHDKLLDIFQRYGVNSNVNVRMSSGLYEIIATGLTVKEFAYVPLVGVNKVRLTGMDVIFKTVFDYCVTIPGIILFSPLLLFIAICIKLDSPGPVIYRRRVMGVNGKEFNAFKFRTMRTDGEAILQAHPELAEELALNHKIKEDPRVTRVGKFLRKTSLDELPQLFNVLLGQMSLVGPRMIAPNEMKKYSQWGINLLTVKPGITGLWQVSGRSDVSYEERVRLDMHYIRNWSIWLDLQLIWRTVPVVLLAHGAY